MGHKTASMAHATAPRLQPKLATKRSSPAVRANKIQKLFGKMPSTKELLLI